MLNFADRVWKNIVSRLYLLMTQRLHLQTTPQPVSDGQGRNKPGNSDGQEPGEAPTPPGTAVRMLIVTEQRHTLRREWRHDGDAMA